jgi:hypothetical protein
MDTGETDGESVDQTELAHNRIQRVALVHITINLMGSYKKEFLIVTSLCV